jgi:lysophospholipase L1-like esterase
MSQTQRPTGPFKSLVVLGESTVEGGGWLSGPEERFADLLAKQLEHAQEVPLTYHNAGVGASVISPDSPGYEASVKPSAAERLDEDVIAHNPDLLVIAYGLNDMRGGMTVEHFRTELVAILDRIEAKITPQIVLVNVYYQTAYHFYPPFDKGGIAQTEAYNQMLRDLAAERGYLYSDIYGAQAMTDHIIHADAVHANKVGNMILANKIFETIVLGCPGIVTKCNQRDATTDWTKYVLEWQSRCVEQSHNSYNKD